MTRDSASAAADVAACSCGAAPVAVTGRDCTTNSAPSRASAHSTSWWEPKYFCTRRATSTSPASIASSRHASDRRSSSTGTHTVPRPDGPARYSMCFAFTVRRTTSPVTFETRYSSGVTSPPTTPRPSPHDASIATTLGSPLTGLHVNMTPDTAASTMSCTVTPISGARPAAILARYVIAGALNVLAQQSRTASHTASAPRTQRYVSCWPANVASPLSSPTALERPATAGLPRSAYAAAICARTPAGTSLAQTAPRIVSAATCTVVTSSGL